MPITEKKSLHVTIKSLIIHLTTLDDQTKDRPAEFDRHNILQTVNSMWEAVGDMLDRLT